MDLLYLTHPLNGLLMISLGVGLGLYLTRKFRLGWGLWFIGGVTFILSQVGHLPFNIYLLNPLIAPWLNPYAMLPCWKSPLAMLLLGLSAGVFEEVARYAMYRWWAKDARTWGQGLLAGAGHGGMEAIILGVLVLLTFLNLSSIRNVDLATLVSPEELPLAQAQVTAYWSAPWALSLLGALERLFTLPFHVAASVMVLQAFRRRNLGWLGLAILWHALLDASVVYLAGQVGPYLTEGFLGLLALINLGIILALRQPEPEPLPKAPLPPPSRPALPKIEETVENLERTRYNE